MDQFTLSIPALPFKAQKRTELVESLYHTDHKTWTEVGCIFSPIFYFLKPVGAVGIQLPQRHSEKNTAIFISMLRLVTACLFFSFLPAFQLLLLRLRYFIQCFFNTESIRSLNHETELKTLFSCQEDATVLTTVQFISSLLCFSLIQFCTVAQCLTGESPYCNSSFACRLVVRHSYRKTK